MADAAEPATGGPEIEAARAAWRRSGLLLVGHGAHTVAGATRALADHARVLH